MSRFTDALLVSPLADGKTWVVRRPFGYEVGTEGSRDIPRALWIFLPKWGTYGNATVIHDWLYCEQHRLRAEADAIFRQAMAVLGVRTVVKHLMYWAVRSFGWLAWYRNQADRAEGFDRVLDTVQFKAVVRSRRPGTAAQLSARAWHKITKPSSGKAA